MPTWTRVRDKATGHEYDVANVRDDKHELIKDYPENEGTTARPRPIKFRVRKDGKPTPTAAAAKNKE